jgi:hypothetical protein
VAGTALKARYDQKVPRTYGETCNRNVLPLKILQIYFLYAGKMTFLDRNVVSRCAVRILVAKWAGFVAQGSCSEFPSVSGDVSVLLESLRLSGALGGAVGVFGRLWRFVGFSSHFCSPGK